MKTLIFPSMIFDDVRFGIEVRDRRVLAGLSQRQLAERIGYKDGVSISAVECARNTDSMSVRRYMALCNALGLNPMHYWTCDEPMRLDGADWTNGNGA